MSSLRRQPAGQCLTLLFVPVLIALSVLTAQADSVPNVVPIPDPKDNRTTFALIPPLKMSDGAAAPGRMQNVLARLSALCPDQTILLQPKARTDLPPSPVNLTALPIKKLPSHSIKEHGLEAIVWPENTLWIYMEPDENATEEQVNAIRSAATERIVSHAPSHLFIVTPEHFWKNRPGTNLWIELGEYLLDSKTPTTVFIGDADRFSHWQKDGIDFFSLNTLDGIKSPDPTEGVFDGVLWGAIDRDGEVEVCILPLYGMLSAQDVSVQNQKIVETLQAQLRATPIVDSDSITNVSFINSMDYPLELKTSWKFNQNILQVDPKIVGFTLAPGEAFEQSFRLTIKEGNGTDLKFLEPEFRLETELPGPGGMPRRINLKTRPWCTLSGSAVRQDPPPKIDGDLGEWTGPGLTISHPVQVISGKQSWSGPADLSANAFFGVDSDNLYIAVSVTDDDVQKALENNVAADQVCVLIGMNTSEETANKGISPLQICVTPAGLFEISGTISDPDATIVASAVSETDQGGYTVEVSIPIELLDKTGFRQGFIRADINLIDADTEDELPTKATLSGRGIDPTLFARIEWEVDNELQK